MSKIKYAIGRISKAIGGALGGLVASDVDWVTNEILQLDFPHDVDTALAVLIAGAAVWVFPKNVEKRPKPVEPVG